MTPEETRTAELSLLSAARLNPSITEIVQVNPDAFADDRFGAIWGAIGGLHAVGAVPTPALILDRCKSVRVDPMLITEIDQGPGVPENAELYAGQIREASAYRRVAAQIDGLYQQLQRGTSAADLAAAAMAIGQEAPSAEVRRSWRAVDLSDVLAGRYKKITPTVGRRSDGIGLFYPGKVHTISSESEAGKTWLMLSAVLDEIRAGHHVVYLDFEDDEGGVVGRLLTLGAKATEIAEFFHYVRPEDPIEGIHRADLDGMLHDLSPTLAVIDGVTEAMTLHGLDPISNSDAARFGRMLPRRLTQFGAASASLDHVPKSTENRGRYAIGAIHKLNGLDGAAYVLENRSAFGVGLTGRSTLKIAKDRPGQLRRHAVPSAGGLHWFGDLVLTSHDEDFAEVEVTAPSSTDANEFKPTKVMGKVMAAVDEHGPLSKRKIRTIVGGKVGTVDKALDWLIVDGYLTESTPHTALEPWNGDS